jgi:hypothetical protein
MSKVLIVKKKKPYTGGSGRAGGSGGSPVFGAHNGAEGLGHTLGLLDGEQLLPGFGLLLDHGDELPNFPYGPLEDR